MPTSAAHRGPSLRMICINDVYTLENLPRLRTLVLEEAERDPADLLLVSLAGDFVSPSLLSSLDQGRGMIDCMNAVPITHVIFGNHEDDIPLEALQERIREFHGTWLSTNLGFLPSLPATQFLHLGGGDIRTICVGLIGVVMEDPGIYRGVPFGGFLLLPANEVALRTTEHLIQNEGCACIIPLTHQDIHNDRALASAQTSPPFPVIIGGHEHTVFLEKVGMTQIIKAGSDAVHAAILNLRWPVDPPAAGQPDLPEVSVQLKDTADYAEDPSLRARVDLHMKAVRDLEQATLFVLSPEDQLSSVGTRERQTSMGTLICSKLRDVFGAEAAIFNGGGIRAGKEYKYRFTYGDLKAEIPFDNDVVVAKIPGSVLRESIELSRSRGVSGGFLQVDDGIVTDMEGRSPVLVAGTPLDEERMYRVVLVRNMLLGMDNIEPLVKYAKRSPASIPHVEGCREAKIALLDAFARLFWTQLGSFEELDQDHDGRISRDEIAAAITRRTSIPASPIAIDLLMKILDTDRDEQVSEREDLKARSLNIPSIPEMESLIN